MTNIAIVPAKSTSRRVERKNFRPFHRGLSLVDYKIRMLKAAGCFDEIILSTDNPIGPEIAQLHGVIYQSRPPELCRDEVNLGELFRFCMSGLNDETVYWAHPTNPFVTAKTIREAVEISRRHLWDCVLGVERRQEFLWIDPGAPQPLNYRPGSQPRSQDLQPVFRVTGGVHVGLARQFKDLGAVSFQPAILFQQTWPQTIDIDTVTDWDEARSLAHRFLG